SCPRTPAPSDPFVDEDIDHPDRIVLSHIVIQTFRKQRGLPTICTLNEAAHNPPPADLRRLPYFARTEGVFTQLQSEMVFRQAVDQGLRGGAPHAGDREDAPRRSAAGKSFWEPESPSPRPHP